eukprot:11715-Prorocentrum_minimum.AAC.1
MPANGGFLWLVLHIHVCCDGVRSAHLQKKVAQDWKTTVPLEGYVAASSRPPLSVERAERLFAGVVADKIRQACVALGSFDRARKLILRLLARVAKKDQRDQARDRIMELRMAQAEAARTK